MRILYGVCGEGMGHPTRSKVVLEYLTARGHEVLVAAAGQALRVLDAGQVADVLGSDLPSGGRSNRDPPLPSSAGRPGHSWRVLPIVGLGMRCAGGAIDLLGSVEDNARRLPELLMQNAGAWEAARAFRPDVAISDFDFFAWAVGRAAGVPVVSIDNGQIVRTCVVDEELIGGAAQAALLAGFGAAMVPDADHFVVTSFYFPPVRPAWAREGSEARERKVSLVPPILRRAVLAAAALPPARPEHVLVYKTGSLDDAGFLRALAALPDVPFVAYGLRGDAAAPLPPNVTARPFDEATFLRDLHAAYAVVGNGGMSLLGEALALGKPVLAVPVGGQAEQVMNAGYLARLGYGMTAPTLEPTELRAFLGQVPRYAAAIAARPQHDGNAALYGLLNRMFGAR